MFEQDGKHADRLRSSLCWHTLRITASAVAVQDPYPGHQYRIAPCAYHVCTAANLQEQYGSKVEYGQDGLLFIHQDSPYVMESNPFALQWRDCHCSCWAQDTDKDGGVATQQEVVRVLQLCSETR